MYDNSKNNVKKKIDLYYCKVFILYMKCYNIFNYGNLKMHIITSRETTFKKS